MFLLRNFLIKLLLVDRPVLERSDAEVEADAESNYRWNFTANLLDGFAFFFGIAFISSSTIVPLFVSKITLNPLVIGFVAMIAQSAWFIPQIFTAGRIERLDRKKPVIINLGFFTERLPVWLWPIAALLAVDYPLIALVLFIVSYAWHGFGAGVVGPAWQDLFARCFPVRKRGLLLGLTTFSGTAAATIGAGMSSWILQEYGFPYNFVFLFTIAAAGITLSWVFLAMTREPLQRAKHHSHGSLTMWSRMMAIFRQDRNFRSYLVARMLLVIGTMGMGFITVVSIERWAVPDSVVGVYTAILLLGQTIGNLLAGLVADRYGHKVPLLLGGMSQVAAFVVAWMITGPSGIYAVFLLIGFGVGASYVSGTLISMEFSEPSRRPTYMGIANTSVGVANVIAPLLGGWIAGFGYGWLFGTSALVGFVALLLLLRTVADPRHEPHASAPVLELA